jgi:hypothetical protein
VPCQNLMQLQELNNFKRRSTNDIVTLHERYRCSNGKGALSRRLVIEPRWE